MSLIRGIATDDVTFDTAKAFVGSASGKVSEFSGT